jgi:hypothetical protein
MKTVEQIKAEILASNPSRKYIINDEEFEQSEAEFQETIQLKAERDFAAQEALAKIEADKEAAQAKLAVLGLTVDDLKALGL